VLYALGDPLSLVLLVVSFLVALTLHGWVQCLVADRTGDRRPRLEGRLRPDPRHHVDPFGAVAGLISGLGWARPVDTPPRSRRGAVLAVMLAGSVVNIVLGLACLLLFRVLAGAGLPAVSASLLQHGTGGGALELRATLLFGLMNVYIGLLSLVPVPPLDGGRLLFALAPRTAGWQKAEYHLVEQNIGVAVVLVLLLLPLGGPQALLPTLLDIIVSPLVRLVTGG
jgi:Zn-dependent protease